VRVAIVGAGAVGAWIGARLAKSGADVVLLARGEHLRAIRAGGVVIRGPGDELVVRVAADDDPHAIGICDVVFFCVKAYDAEAAAAALPPLLDRDTAIVPLLNGIDHLNVLAAAVGPEHVLGGMAAVFAERIAPGVIEHRGGPDSIAFGELDGRRTPRAERLLEICRSAGIADDLSEDIRWVMWQKLAYISAQAGLTAVTRLPLGVIRDSPPTFELYARVLDEVLAVAAAEGVTIREGAAGRMLDIVRALEPGAFSSLHDDLVAGRRMELEALHGAVLRRAGIHGVAVPACETIYALLLPWAARNEPGPR
jgi:2-dehydropantoate 2-reductase